VYVAEGKIQNAGTNGDELAVAPASGAKKVQILTDTTIGAGGNDGLVGNNPEFESFFAYGSAYEGGVRIAQGDTDGSGSLTEVLTEPGTGAGSRQLKIYDDNIDAGSFISGNPREDQFVAFPGSVTAGAFVAFGKVRSGVFPYTGLPAPIPDGGTVTSTIRVPRSAGIIRDLDVFLGIAHSFDGDLEVTLTHVRTGTTLLLFGDVGGTNEGFLIRLNDEAGLDIGSASNPKLDGAITGTFNPRAPPC